MRLALQKKTDLALRALQALAGDHDIVSGAELARRIDSTPQFLPQIIGPLVARGWITSIRGPGGGYRLGSPLDDISLLDVVEAIEGPTDIGVCILRDGPCPGEPSCPIHAVWLEARKLLTEGLETLSVAGALTEGGVR